MPSSEPTDQPGDLPGDLPGEVIAEVETAEGRGRFFVAPAARPRAQLFLGHGAGGGVDAVDLVELARRLPGYGITVVRFEQPWRTAGGRVAVRPPRLDVAWNEALLAALDGTLGLPGMRAPGEAPTEPGLPLFLGGRSAGARVACRTAAAGPLAGRVVGVIACAFPLHPPGRPDRSRVAELSAPAVPRLVLQGDRDSFGSGADVEAELPRPNDVHVVAVPGADHSMRVARTGPISAAQLRLLVVQSAVAFVDAVLGG